jgi:cbb3-type cytochrome oxidase maturation protein
MEALYLLIPLSLVLVAFAVWIFFGAAESGQFEDLDGPALRILHDDDRGQLPQGSEYGSESGVGFKGTLTPVVSGTARSRIATKHRGQSP